MEINKISKNEMLIALGAQASTLSNADLYLGYEESFYRLEIFGSLFGFAVESLDKSRCNLIINGGVQYFEGSVIEAFTIGGN